MKTMTVLVAVVLLAAGTLTGCTSKHGTGTGAVTRVDAASDSATVVAGTNADRAAVSQPAAQEAAAKAK